MDFAPVYPHDPIEQIGDDVFMVRGSIKMNPLVRITRNMAVVRERDALTLVDPIRLRDAELARLESLGEVKHIMRLGALHGIDDPFYVARYRAAFWCQVGGTTYPEPAIDHVLVEGGDLPVAAAKLFCFAKTRQPECALLVESGPGLLLTADAIQHYGDYSHNNLIARLAMPWMGFPRTTVVGPIWLRMMTPEGGTLADEFERLLELDFDRLLSAHGTLLETGARQAVRAAVAKAFPA